MKVEGDKNSNGCFSKMVKTKSFKKSCSICLILFLYITSEIIHDKFQLNPIAFRGHTLRVNFTMHSVQISMRTESCLSCSSIDEHQDKQLYVLNNF